MTSWLLRLPDIRWPRTRKSKILGACILAVGASALTVLLLNHTPGSSALLPPCVFHLATGLYCPGCGITRALHALVHGDLARAWSMNPLALLGLGTFLVELLDRSLGQPNWWSVPRAVLHSARVWATVVIVFVIGRNLPWFPFSTWAPG